VHVNLNGCKYSIYHIIWSTGKKFTTCMYNVTIFAFCISFSSLCQQSYRRIVMDMRCVFEGFTPLWRKTFLAPVNTVRRAQMPTLTQLQLYAQGLLYFARFCLKSYSAAYL